MWRATTPANNIAWELGAETKTKPINSLIVQSVMNDQNPGLDGAGDGAEDIELTPEELTPDGGEGTEGLGGDPLDEISDPVARDEAKKARAIARRAVKAKAVPTPEKKLDAPAPEYITKADFFKTNERKAIREATADPEVKAIWDKIVPLYAPRRGKETPEDILEDIKDAVILYHAHNPEKESDDSAKDLTASPVVKTGGGEAVKTTPKPQDPPNYVKTAVPSEWYGAPK